MGSHRPPRNIIAMAVVAVGSFAAGIATIGFAATPQITSAVLAAATTCPSPAASGSTAPAPAGSPAPSAKPSASPTASPSASAAAASVPPAAGWTVVADGFASLGSGTTGGAGGQSVTVATLDQLKAYASSTKPYVIKVSGVLSLTGQVKIASNKTIVGVGVSSGLTGGGLELKKVSNVIVANLTISKAKGTDAITVWGSTNVLVTHNDLSSDRTNGKDYYDGLVDITQGSDLVTVSYNRFHDHYKVMLIGHSDSNATVDTGKLRVTVHHNSFVNVGSRLPSLRFGTGHVYDNVYDHVDTSAIHSRMGAVILAQNNVMTSVKEPYVTHADSKQDGTILIDPAKPPAWPYSYTLQPISGVTATVQAQAGPQ